jgi:hypothetical protein
MTMHKNYPPLAAAQAIGLLTGAGKARPEFVQAGTFPINALESGAYYTQGVSFPTGFAHTPRVVVSMGHPWFHAGVNSVSASGAQITIVNGSPGSLPTGYHAFWLAIDVEYVFGGG